MKVVRPGPEGGPLGLSRPIAAIGNFDGLHLGHRKVIQRALDHARDIQGSSVVISFDPHPSRVLRPRQAEPTLQTLGQRLELLEQLGADVAAVIGFDEQLAELEPELFVERFLAKQLELEAIYVGHNFRFGYERRGDPALLRRLGRRHGYKVRTVPPVRRGGEVVSSTRIRRLLAQGEVEQAGRLLGRPHLIEGHAVPGEGRGSKLLVPTANLVSANECVPGRGVYGAEAWLRGRHYTAAVFIGRRRTFGETQEVLEAHLLDYQDGPLYGESLRLAFRFRIRGERSFPSLDALREQIHHDLDRVRRLLPAARG